MPSKTDVNKKGPVPLTEIEKDFQVFFLECSGSKLSKYQLFQVLWPLKLRKWKGLMIKYGILTLLTVILVLTAFYVDFFAWNLAAIGRLSLGQLRPIWNWEDLYKAKCLIGTSSGSGKETSQGDIERKVLDYKDCVVCESIDKIGRISNISYQHLHDKYLLRALPLVITDSHEPWSKNVNYATHLSHLPGLVHSKPCELQTNLILYKSLDAKTLFHLASDSNQFFLHLRNCDFEAVKAARAIIPKPYFYSPHLEPPYTSWILLSQNYHHERHKDLSLLNMVIVQQLSGYLDILLEAKDACLDVCGMHHVKLGEGEALVLMSKLWNFKYLPSAKELSVTVVTETYFL